MGPSLSTTAITLSQFKIFQNSNLQFLWNPCVLPDRARLPCASRAPQTPPGPPPPSTRTAETGRTPRTCSTSAPLVTILSIYHMCNVSSDTVRSKLILGKWRSFLDRQKFLGNTDFLCRFLWRCFPVEACNVTASNLWKNRDQKGTRPPKKRQHFSFKGTVT